MLSKKAKKAAALMVTTNLTQREIAEKLDLNESTVSRWKNDDEFKTYKQEVERDYLASLSAPAIRTLGDLLTARSGFVRFQAAKDILDRTGYKPIDKQEIDLASQVVFVDESKIED